MVSRLVTRAATHLLAALTTVTSVFGAFSGTDIFLPSAGRGSGANNSNWYTTAWVFNPGSSPANLQIYFLERAQTNATPLVFNDTIPAGDTKRYPNAVETLFGVQKFGALRFVSSSALVVNGRVYSQPDSGLEKDSIGQFFSGIPASFAIGAGQKTQLLGLYQTKPDPESEYRYNFGLVETTGQSVNIGVRVLDEMGNEIGSKGYWFGAFGVAQYSFSGQFPTVSSQNARLEIEVTGGAGRVVAFGSGLANTSNDPSTFEMSFRQELLADANQPSGLSEVSHDSSLQGEGTPGAPLGLAPAGVTATRIADGSVNQAKLVVSGIPDPGKVIGTTGLNLEWRTAPGLTLPYADSTSSGLVALRVDHLASSGSVMAISGNSYSRDGAGIWGGNYSTSGTTFGVAGVVKSPDGAAVAGYSDAATGEAVGVYGAAESKNGGMGVFGVETSTTGQTYGVSGLASSRDGLGVYGIAESTSGTNVGVYGDTRSALGYAGYFNGAVRVGGYLYKAGGGFQIDHPGDPQNKYLNHFFVESPEMKNVYDAVVVLDASGEAVVTLPAWFEILNSDFRYQLTCIGAFAPVFVAQEIQDGSFRIAGGKPGMKVSWQVTGVRKDPWALAHQLPVEQEKPDGQRGTLLNAEAGISPAALVTRDTPSPVSVVPPPIPPRPRRGARSSD